MSAGRRPSTCFTAITAASGSSIPARSLQVEAIGEIVFYDLLNLFSSYFAAQAFSIALLHGVALTAAFRLWLLVSEDAVAATLATLVLIVSILFSWPVNIFAVLWNPHSYVAGAVLLATGLMGLLLRGPRWAPVAAVGFVALLHGHASFIGLLPICLLTFLGVAALFGRWRVLKGMTPAGVLRFVQRYPVSIGATAGILALGALPILANTLLNWPGEAPESLAQARNAAPNNPVSALKYVWSFVPLFGVWLPCSWSRPAQACRTCGGRGSRSSSPAWPWRDSIRSRGWTTSACAT